MGDADGQDAADPPLGERRLVMCLSPGRSGTALLARLMALAEDTTALHEPEPTFRGMTDGLATPEEIHRFVAEVKLPAIAATPGAAYVETSHLFGKGPADAFLALGQPFGLVRLDRPPRDVATSLARIGSVPGRARKQAPYLLAPGLDTALPLPGWERMTDYQLCYWYVIEMERRKAHYADLVRARGWPVAEVSLAGLGGFEEFARVASAFGLALAPDAEARHAEIAGRKVNAKRRLFRLPRLLRARPEPAEAAVWEAMGPAARPLRAALAARYGAGAIPA